MVSSPTIEIKADPIVQLAYAFRASKVLLSAVELGVFGALAEGPLECIALARKTGIAERGAADFFDTLVAVGMLDRWEDGRYVNTAATDRYLDPHKPTYIGGDLDHLGRRLYSHWASLTTALRTGKPPSGVASDEKFQAMYSDPAILQHFASAMSGGTLPVATAIANTFPWSDYRTFIDIGTAQGGLPICVAAAHPHLVGGGYDLPALQPLFEQQVSAQGLTDRLRFFPGDFLRDPMPSAEVLVLGRVLHNWPLKTKQLLLAKAHATLPVGGAVIVYERLIDDERRKRAAGLLSSLNMLLMTDGGFDFTGADCTRWMQEAGFRGMRVQFLTSDHSMVVGWK